MKIFTAIFAAILMMCGPTGQHPALAVPLHHHFRGSRASTLWNRVHVMNGMIVAIGRSQLTYPILLPKNVRPLAFAYTSSPNVSSVVAVIFFAPTAEHSVYRWAVAQPGNVLATATPISVIHVDPFISIIGSTWSMSEVLSADAGAVSLVWTAAQQADATRGTPTSAQAKIQNDWLSPQSPVRYDHRIVTLMIDSPGVLRRGWAKRGAEHPAR